MAAERDIWDGWQALLHSEQPDLIAILKVGAQFQAYFSTIESETLKAARATGVTWAQLGDALGTTRQAVWQRATTWDGSRRRPGSANRSPVSDERRANLQKAREDWADKRDKAAAAMFDRLPDFPTL